LIEWIRNVWSTETGLMSFGPKSVMAQTYLI